MSGCNGFQLLSRKHFSLNRFEFGELRRSRFMFSASVVMFCLIGISDTAVAAKRKTSPPPAVEAPVAAASCVGCHGPNGMSSNPLWPNLAGQKEGYLAKQLRAFKDESRIDPMMNAIVQTLSDSDVDAIAKYFSSLD